MIEGIDFLEDARSGIRHQHERFDGGGRPDGRAGHEIPIAARIVAVTTAIDDAGRGPDAAPILSVADVARRLRSDAGRFDPDVVSAAIVALDKHGWPASSPAEVAS